MSDDTRANVEVTASSNRLAAGLRAAMSKVQAFSKGVGASMKKIGESSMGSFIGNVGANLAQRGMDFVTDQAKQVQEFEVALTRFGISSGQGRAELDALRKSIRSTSNETGINANEIANAAGVYFDLTSDAEGTAKAMNTFARVAAATGSSMADISQVAAAMQDSLGLTAEQMESVFGSLIAQGKAGKVGLKQMAATLTELLPKFAGFKNSLGPEGMIALGAAFQVASKGFGSASQAATGLRALMDALAGNAAKFEKFGVKIFDVDKKTGVKTFRDLHEIITAIGNSKLGKDPTLLKNAFGSTEALAAFTQLNKLRGMYDDVARAGREGAQSVGQDFQTWIESPAGKVERAMERVKNKIAEAMTPERIEAFADAVENAAEHVSELAEGLGKVFGFLGGLNSVGKKIRGFLSGPGPEGGPMEEARDYQIEKGTGAWILTPDGKWVRRDSNEGRGQVKAAELRRKHRAGYEGAVNDILAGEKDERTTPESIRRAVIASKSGNIGAARAGEAYITNAGVSPEQVEEIANKAVQDSAATIGKGIVDAIKASLKGVNLSVPLNVDSNQVAKASSKATDPRRKT